MVRTWRSIQEQQQCLRRLLVDILLISEDSPILHAFANEMIEMVNNVLMLTNFDIDLLEYIKDDTESDIQEWETLTWEHYGWIRVLIVFINYFDFLSESQLEKITIDIFNEYRLRVYNPNRNFSSNNDKSTNPPEIKTSRNDDDYFKKGQREMNLYTLC